MNIMLTRHFVSKYAVTENVTTCAVPVSPVIGDVRGDRRSVREWEGVIRIRVDEERMLLADTAV